MAVAAGLMVILFFVFVGIEELLRPQNEFSRVHPMFNYLDLGPHKELRSSHPSLLLMAAPLLVGAGIVLFIGWLL